MKRWRCPLRRTLSGALVSYLLLSRLSIAEAAEVPQVESAAQSTPQQEKKDEFQFPRAFDTFALSLAYQAPLSLDKSFAGGIGISYAREYFISRRTALGIHAALRIFPSTPWQLALGYGLTFKHYLISRSAETTQGLYCLYGLLLQMNVLDGREGTATGHDTRLSIGYDWQVDRIFPLVEVGYHLTQVRSFDEDTLWWPYTELLLGLRF